MISHCYEQKETKKKKQKRNEGNYKTESFILYKSLTFFIIVLLVNYVHLYYLNAPSDLSSLKPYLLYICLIYNIINY